MFLPSQYVLATAALDWLHRLGGVGLILLGIADNSVVPLPGSMDVLTIWLAANHRQFWFYYVIMATAGAVLGGYITFRLGRKGGKQTMEHRLPKRKADRICKKFERWGFGAVAIPAMLPPPFPIVPVLLVAGAMQYSSRKFIAALAFGRGVRFTVLALLGVHYGSWIIHFFAHYYKPALLTLIGFSLAGSIFGLIQYKRMRSRDQSAGPRASGTRREVA